MKLVLLLQFSFYYYYNSIPHFFHWYFSKTFIQLSDSISALTLVELKNDRLSDTTLPDVLNANSEATEVAGIARK